MTAPEIRTLMIRVSDRLNNYLCDMKPGHDDSITGFNDAWDIVTRVFEEELDRLVVPK